MLRFVPAPVAVTAIVEDESLVDVGNVPPTAVVPSWRYRRVVI
jgi:hypothetical protein